MKVFNSFDEVFNAQSRSSASPEISTTVTNAFAMDKKGYGRWLNKNGDLICSGRFILLGADRNKALAANRGGGFSLRLTFAEPYKALGKFLIEDFVHEHKGEGFFVRDELGSTKIICYDAGLADEEQGFKKFQELAWSLDAMINKYTATN